MLLIRVIARERGCPPCFMPVRTMPTQDQRERNLPRLSFMEREVALRVLGDGMTCAQIALESQRAEGTIRSLWERARKKLLSS